MQKKKSNNTNGNSRKRYKKLLLVGMGNINSSKSATLSQLEKDFPTVGISLNYIIEHSKSIELNPNTTSSEFVVNIVKPFTEEKQSSFIELIDSKFIKPKADVFISHCWSFNYLELLDVINDYKLKQKKKDLFVWLDLLIINQWSAKNYNHTTFSSQFGECIRVINKVLVPVPNNETHLIPHTTRSWCNFEFYQSHIHKAKFEIQFSKNQSSKFKSQLIQNPLTLTNQLSTIDLAKAKAFDQGDQDMILESINEVGIDFVTEQIISQLLNYFEEESEKAIKKLENDKNASLVELAQVYNRTALLYKNLSNPKREEDLLKKNVKTREKIHANEPHKISASRINLAEFYSKQKKHDRALKLALKAIKDTPENYKNNTATFGMLNVLGGIYLRSGNTKLAMETYEKSKNAKDKISLSLYHNNIGKCFEELNDLKQAEENYKKAIELIENKESLLFAGTIFNLAKLTKDEKLAVEAKAIRLKILGENHSLTKKTKL